MPSPLFLVLVLVVSSRSQDSERRLVAFEKELRTVVARLVHLEMEKSVWHRKMENLSAEMEKLKRSPVAEAIIMKPRDHVQSDSAATLFVKMEEMENWTLRVEQELDSEKQVRRHLEEDLKETQSNIQKLGSQLDNVAAPINTRVVEEVVFSTLENLNKTLFEDHLQSLYYKVNKNETRKLDKRLEELETEMHSAALREAILVEKCAHSSLEEDVLARFSALEADLRSQFEELKNNRGDLLLDRITAILSHLEVVRNSHESATEATLENIQQQLSELRNQSHTEVVGESTDAPISNLNSTDNQGAFSGSRGQGSCERPLVEDPHLLVAEEEGPDGRKVLRFGCRPIGRYVLQHAPAAVTCENGTWFGPLPTCIQLLDESQIEDIVKRAEGGNPCLSGSGDFPDHVHCTRFFKCSHGRATPMDCPAGLHFSPSTKRCDYPRIAKCTSSSQKGLQHIIPPLRLEPGTLDRPYGLMGTSVTGQLIVHPRSTFSLRCLFPESVWGLPSWNFKRSYREEQTTPLNVSRAKQYTSITVTAAKEENSGIYTCLTPFGTEHSLAVVVKAVRCPPLTAEDGVYYRPTPEGEHRVLGTTADWRCREGYSITAVCLASGQWSREPKECTIARMESGYPWKCPPLYTSHIPDLIPQKDEEQQVISFRCAGTLRLVGISFTRCRDDGAWSHGSLPTCNS